MADTKARRDSVISHRPQPSQILDLPPSPSTILPTTSLHTFSMSPSKYVFSLPSFAAMFHPAFTRRFRIRPSMVALFTLLTLAVFCILHQHLNDSSLPAFSKSPQSQAHAFIHNVPHRTSRPPKLPQIKLSPKEELAATISFMAALASNALPDSIDPSSPIDPDLILEFDTRSPKASNELQQVVQDTWTRLPVVLLSRRYSPIGREIKAILSEYNLKPAPLVFDIDERGDEAVMTPVLQRLTAANSLPVLLLAGQPIKSIETIRELHESGQLRQIIAVSGAVIDGKRRKKGRRSSS